MVHLDRNVEKTNFPSVQEILHWRVGDLYFMRTKTLKSKAGFSQAQVLKIYTLSQNFKRRHAVVSETNDYKIWLLEGSNGTMFMKAQRFVTFVYLDHK